MNEGRSQVKLGDQSTGVVLAGGAVLLVGGSVAASSLLTRYPLFGGQAVRYAAASLVLALWAQLRGQQISRPNRREWGWLAALAVVGLAGCSMLQIEATRVTNPATVGVVIGAAPLVIAVIGPVAAGRRPTGRVLAAAALVAASAATAQLGGASGRDGNLLGLVLSIGALLGVAGTSLLAAPVLRRLGPLAVSTYSCALAAGLLVPAAAADHFTEGTPLLRLPTGSEFAALVYLALAVTAVVFLAWYGAVARLGVERTGLFNGLIPVGSLIAVPLVGVGTITGAQVAGAVGVLAGIALGLTDRTAVRTQPTARNRRHQVRTAAEGVETPPGTGGAALTRPDRSYRHHPGAEVQADLEAGRDRGPHDPVVPGSARWPTRPPPHRRGCRGRPRAATRSTCPSQ